jgi:hypothetical protein
MPNITPDMMRVSMQHGNERPEEQADDPITRNIVRTADANENENVDFRTTDTGPANRKILSLKKMLLKKKKC